MLTPATVDYLLGEADVSYRTDRAAQGADPACRWEEATIRAALVSPGVAGGADKTLNPARNSFLAAALAVCQQQGRAPGDDIAPPSIVPKEYWLFSESPLRHAFRGDASAEYDATNGIWRKCIFPSAKPTGRIEVFLLARALDRMMANVDTSAVNDPDLCYSADSEAFSTTFKALFEVYNTGFGELIRQVYLHCAERGVLLDRIRSLYSDFAENCFDLVAHLKKCVRRFQSQQRRAEEVVRDARTDLKTARHQEGLLRAEVANLKQQLDELSGRLKDQEAMERRDVLMRKFLENQADRNAALMQLQVGTQQGSQHTGSEASLVEGGAAAASDSQKASSPRGHGKLQSPRRQKDDDLWDEALYSRLVGFCESLRATVTGCESVTKRVYGKMVYNNPLESARWAKDKLTRLVQTHIMPVVNSPTGAGPAPDEVPGRVDPGLQGAVKSLDGSFEITKQMLSELLGDVNATLREITTRLNSYATSPAHVSVEAQMRAAGQQPAPKLRSVADVVPPSAEALQYCVELFRALAIPNVPHAELLVQEAGHRGAYAGDVVAASARSLLQLIRSHQSLSQAQQPQAPASPRLSKTGKGKPAEPTSPVAGQGGRQQTQEGPAWSPTHRGGGQHQSPPGSPRGAQATAAAAAAAQGAPMSPGGSQRPDRPDRPTASAIASAGGAVPDAAEPLRETIRDREETIEKLRAAEGSLRRQATVEVERAQTALHDAENTAAHWKAEYEKAREVAQAAGVAVPQQAPQPAAAARRSSTEIVAAATAEGKAAAAPTGAASGSPGKPDLASPRAAAGAAPSPRSAAAPSDQPAVIIKLHIAREKPPLASPVPAPPLPPPATPSPRGVADEPLRSMPPLEDKDRQALASLASPPLATSVPSSSQPVPQGLSASVGEALAGDDRQPRAARNANIGVLRTREERDRDRAAARVRRRQIGAKNERLRQILSTFKEYSTKSAQWALRTISTLYISKAKADSVQPTGDPVVTMPEHMFEHLRQKLGSRKLVDDACGSLLATTQKYRDDPRCDLFARFVSEELPTPLLGVFLHYQKTLDDAKFGPEYHRGPDDGVEPAMVSLIRALFVVGLIEQDEDVVNDITAELQSHAVDTDPKTYRDAMIRTGYAASTLAQVPAQWGTDEATARMRLPRITFLKLVVRRHAVRMGFDPDASTGMFDEKDEEGVTPVLSAREVPLGGTLPANTQNSLEESASPRSAQSAGAAPG